MPFQSYLNIEGAHQGQIASDVSKGKGGDRWIELASVSFGSSSIASSSGGGGGAGKSKSGPVVITKEQDSASPVLFNAAFSKDVMKEVIIERRLRGHTVSKVTLKDATITQIGPALALPHMPAKGKHYERIEFSYRLIDYQTVTTSKTAPDDWTSTT